MHNFYAKIQKSSVMAKLILALPRTSISMNTASKDWKPTFIPFAKARKRIETDFSQFVGQFMLNRNFAKQPAGLFARVDSENCLFVWLNHHRDMIPNLISRR